MTVILINPNSTEAMTATMLAAARAAAPTGLAVDGWTSRGGPAAIQGPEDGARAAAPMLTLIDRAVAEGATGAVIGCFDDTALIPAARRAPFPVVGIGQAAFHFCALRGWRFGVVTTLSVSVPVIEDNLAGYGLAGFCARVRASGVPVLALEDQPEAAGAAIRAEAETAWREDDIDALILGCAGMARIADQVRSAVQIPVIDPVEAAIGAFGWLRRPAVDHISISS
ncbi:MAG: aspartate/glutamate racemase family protein [Pseudomonadota bacterium]